MAFDQREVDEGTIWENPMIPGSYKFTPKSPITPRENFRRSYKHEQMWMPSRRDQFWFCPEIIPDNPVRATVVEAKPYKGAYGGLDMFGVEWEYEEKAHGSIVRPGDPYLKDIKEWKSVVKFPDLDSWDWEGSAELNREFLKNETRYSNLCVFTGWFERLLAFMNFAPAAMALMNKDQKPYTTEFLTAITDLWIDLIDHAHKAYGPYLDGFAFHDDWGAMHAPFFNAKIISEMIVPHMKRVTDHAHSLGYTCELHSCGLIDKLVPCMIDAGWDSWEGMKINNIAQDYITYGDKIMLGVSIPEPPEGASEEEQIRVAREFVEQYGDKNRPVFTGLNTHPTPIQLKEIYKETRILFEK